MALTMRRVYSSRVEMIGYDDETAELVVVWVSGKRSRYADVPFKVANEVMNAPSVGSAIHDQIEGAYAHAYG